MTNGQFKARDVHPTVLRLHPDTRAELARLAFANGRSLSKEISVRLETSLRDPAAAAPLRYSDQPHQGAAHAVNDNGPDSALSDADRAILEIFRRLPAEKQLALISLFK